MANFLVLGLFENVDTTADVLDSVRAAGIDDQHINVMSHVPIPYEVLGRKSPRSWFLPFALGGSVVGMLVAFFITFITPRIYPIHVGAQELTPVPPTAIIFFEMIALFTMLGTFVGFLLQVRFPILTRQMYDERITDGYIGVEVNTPGDMLDQIVGLFESHGAKSITREDAAAFKPQGIRHLLFWGGIASAGLVALLVPLLLSYDIVGIPWINKMDDTLSVRHQEGPRRAAPAESIPVSGPVLINGNPASQPLPADERSLARGEALYAIHCALCHGARGDGDGLVGRYYTGEALRDTFPLGVPALAGRDLPADYIFLMITNGRTGLNAEGLPIIRMPSLRENLTPGDTWDVVNYVRSMPAP